MRIGNKFIKEFLHHLLKYCLVAKSLMDLFHPSQSSDFLPIKFDERSTGITLQKGIYRL